MLPYVVPKHLHADKKLDRSLGGILYKILSYMAE